MFTGIIEELGAVGKVLRGGGGLTLTIHAEEVVADLERGHSISVNGVCLTITDCDGGRFSLRAVEETVRTTTLGHTRVGDRVNLERAVKASDRLGGHIVTGHVDGIGIVSAKDEKENSLVFSIDIPDEMSRYIVRKGSVAVDGVSLTVADVVDSRMVISVIPHTAKVTTFGLRKGGDAVNIEVDCIGKYVERLCGSKKSVITEPWLREMGY